jgi:hypothetical protein
MDQAPEDQTGAFDFGPEILDVVEAVLLRAVRFILHAISRTRSLNAKDFSVKNP